MNMVKKWNCFWLFMIGIGCYIVEIGRVWDSSWKDSSLLCFLAYFFLAASLLYLSYHLKLQRCKILLFSCISALYCISIYLLDNFHSYIVNRSYGKELFLILMKRTISFQWHHYLLVFLLLNALFIWLSSEYARNVLAQIASNAYIKEINENIFSLAFRLLQSECCNCRFQGVCGFSEDFYDFSVYCDEEWFPQLGLSKILVEIDNPDDLAKLDVTKYNDREIVLSDVIMSPDSKYVYGAYKEQHYLLIQVKDETNIDYAKILDGKIIYRVIMEGDEFRNKTFMPSCVEWTDTHLKLQYRDLEFWAVATMEIPLEESEATAQNN